MTAPAMSERQFQSAVVDLARYLGLLVFHPYDSRRSEPGWPDLVICGPRGVIYRELKTTKGRLSPAQRKWLSALNQAGQDADVWRPEHFPDQVKTQLEAIR